MPAEPDYETMAADRREAHWSGPDAVQDRYERNLFNDGPRYGESGL